MTNPLTAFAEFCSAANPLADECREAGERVLRAAKPACDFELDTCFHPMWKDDDRWAECRPEIEQALAGWLTRLGRALPAGLEVPLADHLVYERTVLALARNLADNPEALGVYLGALPEPAFVALLTAVKDVGVLAKNAVVAGYGRRAAAEWPPLLRKLGLTAETALAAADRSPLALRAVAQRWLAEMVSPAPAHSFPGKADNEDASGLGSPAGTPQPKVSKLFQALAVLQKHPTWKDRDIAAEVGCSPAYLSKTKKYQDARAALSDDGKDRKKRSDRHRGTDMDEYAE